MRFYISSGTVFFLFVCLFQVNLLVSYYTRREKKTVNKLLFLPFLKSTSFSTEWALRNSRTRHFNPKKKKTNGTNIYVHIHYTRSYTKIQVVPTIKIFNFQDEKSHWNPRFEITIKMYTRNVWLMLIAQISTCISFSVSFYFYFKHKIYNTELSIQSWGFYKFTIPFKYLNSLISIWTV